MGYELYRMIRDGAPPSWTPDMRLLAMVIADDARPDPSQGLPPDGGWPLSKIRLHGHHADDGQWYDGLTERTGLTERGVSRILADLARAGYEMREQIGTDKHERPVFAYPWRARRFRVPPLPPRRPPDQVTYSPPDTVTYSPPDTVTYSPPDQVTYSPPDSATTVAERPQVARSGGVGDQNQRPARSPDPVTSFPIPLPVPNPSRRTSRTGRGGEPAATEDDDSATGKADLDGHVEGTWSGQPDDDDLDYETRPRRSPGLGQCAACGGWFLAVAGGLINRHTGTRPDGSYGTCPGARQPPVRPVRCTGPCGRTGLALASLTGLCSACTRERKEAEDPPW